MASVPATAPLGHGHVVVDLAAAQERAALNRDGTTGQLAIDHERPAGNRRRTAIGARAGKGQLAAADGQREHAVVLQRSAEDRRASLIDR